MWAWTWRQWRRLSSLHSRGLHNSLLRNVLLDDGEGDGSVELLVVGGEGGDGSKLPVLSDKGVSGDELLVVGVEGVGDNDLLVEGGEGGGVKLLGNFVFDSSFCSSCFWSHFLGVHN